GGRDEAAFAELVRRHGPLVMGIGRRVLGHAQDAEDVFQAAFLVLARKAAAVPWQESVGGWLFPVAYHLALKVRADRERRRRRETQVSTMPDPAPPYRPADADLRAVLDEELARLPDHYRGVVTLCYLEGKTQHEAARQLGLSPGEQTGRPHPASPRLRRRRARRGLPLPAGGLAVARVAQPPAAVPAALAEDTARAATLFAARSAGLAALVTPRVVALTRGALNTMLATKAKPLF